MKFLKLLSLIVILCGVADAAPHGDSPDSATSPNSCLTYRFRAGDSLTYRCIARDSISLGTNPTLVRLRSENITIICDFVDTLGRMYIRQTLTEYESKEFTTQRKPEVRNSTPWIGRTAYIILDKEGRRILSRQLDTAQAVLSPGGAFQPMLLFPLGDTICGEHFGAKNWLYRSVDTLAEFGYPYPLINHLYSFGIKRTVDTLGEKCINLTYAETGQASHRTITTEIGVYQRTVVNGTGDIFWSEQRSIPLSGFLKNENKLTIVMESRPSISGKLTSSVEFVLTYPPLLSTTK